MGKVNQWVLGIIGLLSFAWAFNWLDVVSFEQAKPEDSKRTLAISECVGISENSVAHMVAVVEFQKLEIEGRRARVMRMCMSDKGFEESAKWTMYAKPIAEQNAALNKTSVDEALELLKRTHMVLFKASNGAPEYWHQKKVTLLK